MRKAFSLLYWEGAFGMAYETWLGPLYLAGLAGELGVQVGWVSVLSALPWIAATGQIASAWITDQVPNLSIKRQTLWLAGLARGVWLLPLFGLGFWGALRFYRGEPFPIHRWFSWMALSAAVAALLGSSSTVAWNSWVKALVPDRYRGRFFGTRQRHVMAALVATHLLGSFWTGWKPGGYWVGHGVVFISALLAALTSTWLLSQVPDAPQTQSQPHAAKTPAIRVNFLEPFRDPEFRKVLWFAALFQGAIQLAGPYFPYYFTRDLKIPMSSIALWSMLTSVGSFLASAYWGRALDRGSGLTDVRPLLFLACGQIVFSPLPYLLPSSEWIQRIGPVEYFINGIAWSGYLLITTTLLHRTAPPGKNVAYFAVAAALTGWVSGVATLLGGVLADGLRLWGGFRSLFALAILVRGGTLLIFGSKLKNLKWKSAEIT